MAFAGAHALLEANQVGSGADLAMMYLGILSNVDDGGFPVTAEEGGMILNGRCWLYING